jgi:hypothetical protein
MCDVKYKIVISGNGSISPELANVTEPEKPLVGFYDYTIPPPEFETGIIDLGASPTTFTRCDDDGNAHTETIG